MMSDKEKIEALEKRVAYLELALENQMANAQNRPRQLTEDMKQTEREIEQKSLNALKQCGLTALTMQEQEDNAKNQAMGRILPKPFF